jgi:hypothetical protein
MRWPTVTSSSSWSWIQARSLCADVEQNFTEFSDEIAHDYFGKRHESVLRVGRHGEAALEGSGTVSSADPGAEDEGVAAVEVDGWLDEN